MFMVNIRTHNRIIGISGRTANARKWALNLAKSALCAAKCARAPRKKMCEHAR